MVGRRPVEILPESVTGARARRTDIRVRIMPVNAPRLQNAVDKAFVTRTPDVINDFISFFFQKRRANLRGNRVQNLVPRNSLPTTFAPPARPLHRVKNAVNV